MDDLRLRPWSTGDADLLRAANTPEMTANLNGPETEDQVDDRHARYLRYEETGEARVFVIEDAEHRRLGSIGCWSTEWRGEPALESGWFVLPEFQGHGIASGALSMVIEVARRQPGRGRYLTAFPSVENPASNGVCRRNGFTLMGTVDGEFRGAPLRSNEWALDLDAVGDSSSVDQ
jgi:RimJ/RimL family protein N-acetyltransferase